MTGPRMMADIKTVGFIGIGNMGRPMAANLVKGGYQVVVYDLDGRRAQRAAKEIGAKAAATLAELGKSADAIVTMLPTGKEVRACLFETEGGALAANLPKGALVIDMSSADPVGSRRTQPTSPNAVLHSSTRPCPAACRAPPTARSPS